MRRGDSGLLIGTFLTFSFRSQGANCTLLCVLLAVDCVSNGQLMLHILLGHKEGLGIV